MRKFNKIIVVVLSLIIGGAVLFHLYERYSPIWFKYAETLAQGLKGKATCYLICYEHKILIELQAWPIVAGLWYLEAGFMEAVNLLMGPSVA